MVLTHRAKWAVIALAFALSAGCIHRQPPVRAPQPTDVAVAFVADSESGGQVSDVPEQVKAAVTSALAARNLTAQVIPFEKVQDAYSRVRASPRRFEFLKEATSAPLLLLVETKPSFFSQIGGRYRWLVSVKVTGNLRQSDAEATTRSLEEAVVLVFDHQRGPEAQVEAAPRIADSAGELFDDLLATPAGPAQDAPRPTPAPGDAQGGASLPDEGAIYFVMVDRFANGDPSNDGEVDPKDPQAFHGGDLQGLIDRLDYLKALGVETVWLSPVFKMRTEKFYGYGAFHGYWVEDLREVEPRFGTKALLRKLSDELHRRGMKLVLDMVLNHVGPDTPLVTQKPHWFHKKGALEKWDDPVELVTKDVHGLPDLAQDHPEVYQHLLDASIMWIDEVKPDGFRLDAVKHMPASFWARYTSDIRKHAGADFLLLGEMLDGDPKVLARTMREGGFTTLFDFPLHFAVNDVFCKDQSPARLGAALSSDRMYAEPAAMVTLVDNHDLPRIVSACRGDLSRVKDALLVTLTARGTPSLTWGTEAALAGAHEPENRADMRFDRLPLHDYISRVMALRGKHPSLLVGAPLLLHVAQDAFAYARVTDKELAVIVVNRSDAALDAPVPHGDLAFTDALSGARAKAASAAPGETRVWIARGDFAALHGRALAEWKGRAEPRQVVFTVSDVPARPGDSVHVVGSAAELGAWEPKRAPAIGPGKSHVELVLPAGSVSEYKLVILGADGTVKWEDRHNRLLFVRAGAEPIALDLRWDQRDEAQVQRTGTK